MTEEKTVPTELTDKERKNFAREQLEFLKQQGITDKRRLSRIFKAAGPGQIKAAWALATCENWETEEEKQRKDLLDCILCGAGCVRFGWQRMASVLKSSNFPIPEAFAGRQFFRILDGAGEILSPGSFDFSDDELNEIEAGLNRQAEREEEPCKKE